MRGRGGGRDNSRAIRRITIVTQVRDGAGHGAELLETLGFICVVRLRDNLHHLAHNLHIHHCSRKCPAMDCPIGGGLGQEVGLNGMVEVGVGDGHFSRVSFPVAIEAFYDTVPTQVRPPPDLHAFSGSPQFLDNPVAGQCVDTFGILLPQRLIDGLDANSCLTFSRTIEHNVAYLDKRGRARIGELGDGHHLSRRDIDVLGPDSSGSGSN